MNVITMLFVCMLLLIGCGGKNRGENTPIINNEMSSAIVKDTVSPEPDSLTRLQNIKEMVGECNKLLASGPKTCKKGKRIVKEEFNYGGEGEEPIIETRTHTAEKCTLSNGYAIHKGDFFWYNVKIYLKNDIPFFAFSEFIGEEGWYGEDRIYYTTKGDILAIYTRENEGGGTALGKNKTLKTVKARKPIIAQFRDWAKDINKIAR